MNSSFEAFDFHRIFLGDSPPLFLLEIVFRTFIMYAYTVFLLRILGKREMGQLSLLELAIIISFGSAVSDPMIGADIPVLYGIVAITAIAIFQLSLERLINKNKKIEYLMEGKPNLVVENGMMVQENLEKDNISKEDLFRALRSKDVEHLGQVKKAFFETSGKLSVLFHSPKAIQPGLSVLPDDEINDADKLKKLSKITEPGSYSCLECGHTKTFKKMETVSTCEKCSGELWMKATQ